MISFWVLIVVTCSGPGPTGTCRIEQRPKTYDAAACRQNSIREEMMDERKRAWCQIGKTKVDPYTEISK